MRRLSANTQTKLPMYSLLISSALALVCMLFTTVYLWQTQADPIWIPTIIFAFVTSSLFFYAFVYLYLRVYFALRESEAELSELSRFDPLTKVFNRHYFLMLAEREMSLSRRHHYPVSMIVFEFDNFKNIIEHYGHQSADEVLIIAIKKVQKLIRNTDILSRYSAEEFILLLPHTQQPPAIELAERIRRMQTYLLIPHEDDRINISISIGYSSTETKLQTLDELLNHAMQVVEQDKIYRNNRVGVTKAYATA
jgi:diguanylate cyclase (GGDEF)-like protein